MEPTYDLLEKLLEKDVKSGKIELRMIDGLTIENRSAAGQAIPDDVLEEIKACNVLLKGPTTTPRKGDKWGNIESANVAMRKKLDLFANVRPVAIPELGVDWTFFRENTECLYALGSDGIDVTDDLAIDFRVITTQGTERIAKMAFDYAQANGKDRVSIVTKANIVKKTDGKFLEVCKRIGEDYPGITVDDWYIDIATAKLVDPNKRSDFQVFILPNLYGDIITDEAAQLQGGVGTAGSANIGQHHAMFEAIHGSAPRMITEGRSDYANPSSIMVDSKIDYSRPRNLALTSVVFITGLSGAFIQIGSVKLTGMCLATIVGIILGIVFYILDKLKLTNDYEENDAGSADETEEAEK